MEAGEGTATGVPEAHLAADIVAAKAKLKEYYKRPRVELAQAANGEGEWAGFWYRLAAGVLDGMILYIPTFLLFGFGLALAGKSEAAQLLSLFFPAFVVILYHGLLTGGSHVATPGRMAAGIAIVDASTGRPLSYARSMARAVASTICYLLIIPNLFVLFTRKKQSAADMMVGSTVVRYRPGYSIVVAVVAALFAIFMVGILAAIAIPQYQDYVVRAKVAEARVDLKALSVLVENHWRRSGRPPDSLAVLSFTPTSRSAKYSITPQGVLVAEALGGPVGAGIALQPIYDKNTDTLQWKCVASGWTVKSQRPRDCEHLD